MSGKTLLVLGGSSDMGMALVRSVAHDYDAIIVHYRTMSESLADLQSVRGGVHLMQADLSDEAQVLSLISRIKAEGLSPTHIVHFAAPPVKNERFHKIRWDTVQKEFDISLRSVVLILQAFLPEMAKRKSGRVVLMLSWVVNALPPAYCSDYVLAKYALLGLVKSLAVEYADKGITVNGVSPAWVMTKYIREQPEYLIAKNAEDSPIGRNLETDDIVPAIAFLLSDGASCINGENISITCGRRA